MWLFIIIEILPYLKVGYILMCLGQKCDPMQVRKDAISNFKSFVPLSLYYSVMPCLDKLNLV